MAQTTAIPDNNFEQALIDLGIDSDGTINGQVLTSDIANIVVLDISGGGIPFHNSIQDLTGIEDFTALEELNVSGNQITNINLTSNGNLKILYCNDVAGLTTLDLSGNPLLEELYCSSNASDVLTIELTHIDLSNNPNIQIVEARNTGPLHTINLKNGNNNNMDQLYLDIYFEGFPDPNVPPKTMCIQVDDETAAQQNQYPYSSWTILDFNVNYSFSENCTLGISEANQSNIRLFPNPVQSFLNIENRGVQLEKIEIFNLQGQKVKSVSKNLKRVDMRFLSTGVYFVKIYSNQGGYLEKIIIK